MRQKKTVGFRAVAATVVLAVACAVAMRAQEPPSQPTQQPTQPQPPQAQPAQPQSAQAQQPQLRPASGQTANIRLAILLTDTVEGKTVTQEPISFLLADRQLGRLRRHLPANLPFANGNFEIDATPEIVGPRVKVSLTLNYNAGNVGEARDQTHTTQFVETATAFLDAGKPTTIVEASGDTANRRLTLQVTATILK